MKRKTEHKEGERRISIQKERICPVCGEEINEVNLPEARSVVEEKVYHLGGVRIIDSEVLFLVSCEHLYRDIGITVDDPHEIAVVVKGLFDDQGACVHFEITEIRAGG